MKNKLDKMFESDFIRVPRPFIRKFSLNTAIMLSEIYSEYTYWKDRNELRQEDGSIVPWRICVIIQVLVNISNLWLVKSLRTME